MLPCVAQCMVNDVLLHNPGAYRNGYSIHVAHYVFWKKVTYQMFHRFGILIFEKLFNIINVAVINLKIKVMRSLVFEYMFILVVMIFLLLTVTTTTTSDLF